MGRYIHYGHKDFNGHSFVGIKNEMFPRIKPVGGFWASPVDAKYGWKDWCDSEKFIECNKNNSFEFSIDESANIFHIYSVSDLKRLPENKMDSMFSHSMWYCIDFEQCVKMGIDAIELHLSEDRPEDLFNSLYYALYGWDCDSILIMNPNIIKI